MKNYSHVLVKLVERLMLLFGFTVFSTTVFSQNIIIPPSPNVASISSGIHNQLSQYTGKANIQIPIYTIETGNLTIPISLSYNTGGIKVNEIASWCGLGWNLNAGGLISRSVVGLSDETPDIGYNAFNILYDNPTSETKLYPNYNVGDSVYEKFALGKADGEPDQYYFSLPHVSGKIKNSWNYGYSTQADQKFSVSNKSKDQSFGSWANGINATNICGNNFNDFNLKGIDEWTLKDGYGNSYQFSDKEQSSSHLRSNYSGPSAYRPYYMTDSCYKSVNSWYLSSITPPGGGVNDLVIFEYDSIPLVYDLPSNITLMSKQSGPTLPSLSGITYSNVLQAVQVKRLSATYFPGGAVKFIPTNLTRADFVNDKALDRIVIENEKGDIIRQFVFNYKYLFGNQLLKFDSVYASSGSGLLYHWNYYFPEGGFDGRLILESITEQDKQGNSINSGISFNYIHDIGLPERGSLSTDYWGFYNGFNDPPFIFNSGIFQGLAPDAKSPNIRCSGKS